MNDPLKGIADGAFQKIEKQLHIVTMSDLLYYKSNGSITECPKNLSTHMNIFLNICDKFIAENRPQIQDYRNEENPYLARYDLFS